MKPIGVRAGQARLPSLEPNLGWRSLPTAAKVKVVVLLAEMIRDFELRRRADAEH